MMRLELQNSISSSLNNNTDRGRDRYYEPFTLHVMHQYAKGLRNSRRALHLDYLLLLRYATTEQSFKPLRQWGTGGNWSATVGGVGPYADWINRSDVPRPKRNLLLFPRSLSL